MIPTILYFSSVCINSPQRYPVRSVLTQTAERKDAELADVSDGVSASLSGPQLEVGDGGGREKEMEGCKRVKGVEPRVCVHVLG